MIHRECCPEEGCEAGPFTPREMAGHKGGAHDRQFTLTDIEHGTWGGYKKHIRRGERACAECARAWRKYVAAGRTRRRKA